MNSRLLFSTLALVAVCALTGCGGGGGGDDAEAAQGSAQVSSGGISGSGVVAQSGGISGSGVVAQSGGISGSGVVAQSGGISGSGVVAQSGGISGSGVVAQNVGGVSGSGIMSVSSVQGCGLASVYVTIASVRLNTNGVADLGSAGWVDVALATPVRVDLMALAAGGALPIDLTSLPDGTYRQMRLLLVADDANTPLADSVVTASSVESALAVPGAAQGGLPMAIAITVAGGQVSASYRDLDVCKSVTATASTYALGPVSAGATLVASAY